MGGEPLFALPPRVLVAGRLQSAVPLVRVCAAGVGSVRSWRTWRRAFTTGFTLDMLKNGRFLRGSWVSGTSLAGGGALLNSRMLLGGGAQPPQHEQLTSRGGGSTPPARTIDF